MANTSRDDSEPRPEFMVALGLMPPYTVEDVKRAYFEKARTAHPDGGGSVETFVKLHDAYVKATEFAGQRASHIEWLGGWVEQYAQQQAIAEEVFSRGGNVEIEKPKTVTASIGADFGHVLERMIGIAMRGRSFGDADVEYLTSRAEWLKTIRYLDLSGSQVTDKSVERLTVFSGLERIDLSDTATTAAVLPRLQTLSKLKELRLAGTRIGFWPRWKMRRWLKQ